MEKKSLYFLGPPSDKLTGFAPCCLSGPGFALLNMPFRILKLILSYSCLYKKTTYHFKIDSNNYSWTHKSCLYRTKNFNIFQKLFYLVLPLFHSTSFAMTAWHTILHFCCKLACNYSVKIAWFLIYTLDGCCVGVKAHARYKFKFLPQAFCNKTSYSWWYMLEVIIVN
jgi:hypothetical protein